MIDDMPEIALDRRRIVVAAVVLFLLLALGGRLLLRSGQSAPVPALVTPTAPPARAAQPQLVVHIVGAVRHPGLYRLAQGSRVADALARAGGATRTAQLELVNLAAPIADGVQVVVPRRGTVVASAGQGAAGTASSGPVHLNTATLEQLDALPGVGPVTAQKILDYRQKHGAFGAVEELDAIPGIGPARLEELRDLVAP
jgi:competence protein ComEA